MQTIAPLDPIRVGTTPAERIVDAALRCVARWGMAKTTLDDVAREAGCGRATLYRLFPGGRDGLWEAVLRTEAQRLLDRVGCAVAAAADLEGALTGAITETSRALRDHEALRFLLAHEPEAVLPSLAFDRMDAVLRAVSRAGAPLMAPWLEPSSGASVEESAARAVEWITRIVLSYFMSPANDVDLCDEESTRRFVRTFVLPGLVPAPR